MASADEQTRKIRVLLECVGLDETAFLDLLQWTLSEHLLRLICQVDSQTIEQWTRAPNGLNVFREHVEQLSCRQWSFADITILFERMKNGTQKHFRRPIPYGDYLRLLWTSPYRCAECGVAPPVAKLHIDHIVPVKHGGGSVGANLQFLCAPCNLTKSSRLPEGMPWLRLD